MNTIDVSTCILRLNKHLGIYWNFVALIARDCWAIFRGTLNAGECYHIILEDRSDDDDDIFGRSLYCAG
jgi:hypothetical protein